MRGTVGLLSCSVACDHSAADVAAGGCSYAGTINLVHTGATCFADLRDHAILLMERSGTSAYRQSIGTRGLRHYPPVNGDYPETDGEYGDYPGGWLLALFDCSARIAHDQMVRKLV